MKFQKNIETWNKQTNFKLNHDVASQMWSEAKLGHLLLLGPFRMLEIRYAWTLIMMKWLRLALGRLEPWLCSFDICLKWLKAYTWKACILWAFSLWCWSFIYTFNGHKCWALTHSRNKFGLPCQVQFNYRLLGLSSFITYKVQTIMMGSSVGLGLIMVQTMAKHMYNAMQFRWTDLKVGSMGHYNMSRR